MSKHKILAVDDSPTILKILEVILKQAGYDFYSAADGLEGIRMAKKVRPDLMILDFIMPKMNGFQVCKAVRKDEELNDTPIIIMSAKGEKVGSKLIDMMGAVDYITKPFSPESLLTLIPTVIRSGGVSGVGDEKSGVEQRAKATTLYDLVYGAHETIMESINQFITPNFKSVADTFLKAKTPADIMEIVSDVLSESLNNELFEILKKKFEKFSTTSAAEGISMKGLLSQVPLPEVFQFAKFQNHTGLLKVTNLSQTAFIFMRGGTISLAAFADLRSKVFRYKLLEELGMEEYSINKAIRISDTRKCPIAETIVNEQIMSKSDLFSKLDKMTKYVVYEVLIWPQGSFSFHLIEKHDPEIQAIDLGITMDQLVMDGLRRLDELKVMQQSIHSASQVFERDPGKQIDMSRLSENQQKVVPHLDGIKNLGKIKDLLKLDTYDVTRALHGLLKSGFIREKTVGQKTVNE